MARLRLAGMRDVASSSSRAAFAAVLLSSSSWDIDSKALSHKSWCDQDTLPIDKLSTKRKEQLKFAITILWSDNPTCS